MSFASNVSTGVFLIALASCSEQQAAAPSASTSKAPAATHEQPATRVEIPVVTPPAAPKALKAALETQPLANDAAATALVGELITALGGVTDAASAQAAAERFVPRISELASAKNALIEHGFDFTSLRNAVDESTTRVEAAPEAKTALAPLLEALRAVLP